MLWGYFENFHFGQKTFAIDIEFWIYNYITNCLQVYCCCCKKKKEPENDKGSQKLQQIYFPSVKPDMKDPKMIQPGGSPLYTPPGSITPVQTPTGRIKAKGLLERWVLVALCRHHKNVTFTRSPILNWDC